MNASSIFLIFPRLRRTLGDVCLLNLLGGLCLAGLWLAGGLGGGGLGPYCREVAANTLTEAAALRYAVYLTLYAALLELVLRLTQRGVARLLGPAAAVALLAAAYGLTHLKFSVAGWLYATVLGLILAAFYARTRRLASLVAWHVQWEFAAVAFVVLSAIAFDGDARGYVLHAYKSRQVASGRIAYLPRWGWVDRVHDTAPHIRALCEQLTAVPGGEYETDISSGFETMFGPETWLTVRYRFDLPADADPLILHAMASRAHLDFTLRFEREQARALPWSGARFSAFAFDDLPSALYGVWASQPDQAPLPPASHARSLQRWASHDDTLLRRPIREPRDFTPADPALAAQLADLLDRIDRVAPPRPRRPGGV